MAQHGMGLVGLTRFQIRSPSRAHLLTLAEYDFGSSRWRQMHIEGSASFIENLDFNGNAIRIECEGKTSVDEINFVRQVGDFRHGDDGWRNHQGGPPHSSFLPARARR